MRNLFLLLFAALVVAFIFGDDVEVSRPPGILVAEEPRQTNLYGEKPFEFKGCRITPLAEFSVRARVLSKEHYWFDGGSRISPLDLALGWGRMSDQAILRGEHQPVGSVVLVPAQERSIPNTRGRDCCAQRQYAPDSVNDGC